MIQEGFIKLAPLARPANSLNKEYVLTMPNGREINAKWSCSKDTFDNYVKDNRLVIPRNGEGMPRVKIFLSELDGQIPNTWLDNVATNDSASKEIEKLFGSNSAFSYAKPEKLIQYLINLGTNKNDIVLDYHLGSGTTASAAHKMNRQYIGIEQMDYIETVAVERLNKVIEGEQGGISKAVNWKGGGAFTYLELKKYNQTFIEHIEAAKNSKALLEIWEQMKSKSFLNYNVDLKKQDAHIEDFKQLELAQQKEHLVALLDKNQLYVNVSSIDDSDFEVCAEDHKVTTDFYQLNR